jgi:hypothetical protein
MTASTKTRPHLIGRDRLESLEWRRRAAHCPVCRKTVVARQRYYYPELQGLAIFWYVWALAALVVKIFPQPWRCQVCGTRQRRRHLGAKEGLALVEAINNTDRLIELQREEAPPSRGPPRYHRPKVTEVLAEHGTFVTTMKERGYDVGAIGPAAAVGAAFEGLAGEISAAAYRGMKPWLVQTIMVVVVGLGFVIAMFGGVLGALAALLITSAVAIALAHYRRKHRRARTRTKSGSEFP